MHRTMTSLAIRCLLLVPLLRVALLASHAAAALQILTHAKQPSEQPA